MAINSLNPALNAYLGNVTRPGTDAARSRTEQAGVRAVGTPAQPTRPGAASIAAPAQPTLAAAAPQGTDPELWSVLTGEERAYFAKAATMGPLTYGRIAAGMNAMNGMQQSAPAARGVRLDVRA
jgi:hypothetical protein